MENVEEFTMSQQLTQMCFVEETSACEQSTTGKVFSNQEITSSPITLSIVFSYLWN